MKQPHERIVSIVEESNRHRVTVIHYGKVISSIYPKYIDIYIYNSKEKGWKSAGKRIYDYVKKIYY